MNTILIVMFCQRKKDTFYKGSGKYEVKITSATNNPNIIFELSLKDNVDFDMFTIQCLIEYITNNM